MLSQEVVEGDWAGQPGGDEEGVDGGECGCWGIFKEVGEGLEVVGQDGGFEDILRYRWPPPLTPFSSDSGYQAIHRIPFGIWELTAMVEVVKVGWRSLGRRAEGLVKWD